MKYIDEFRNADHTKALAARIADLAGDRSLTFMEVCGTHTMALGRFGIRALLPSTIRLISGPGCPVCVTDNRYLDHAIALARMPGAVIATFGDMMKVPASTSSLARCRAEGGDIRVVSSTMDALALARGRPDRQVIFLGVGFETTTPTVAASIKLAHDEKMTNYSVLAAPKLVPPALTALLAGDLALDGFLLPGHVSSIIGGDAYRPLLGARALAAAVAGFEPSDIMQALNDMVEQAITGRYEIDVSYRRVVDASGNRRAQRLVDGIFEPGDAVWRGIGAIPASGLAIRPAYAAYDAARKFAVDIEPTRTHAGCRCGEILQGQALPADCPQFGDTCTPDHPVGPCMVSAEGTCAAYYTYQG